MEGDNTPSPVSEEDWVSSKRDEQTAQYATVENVNLEAPGNQWWHAGRDVQSS